MRKIYLSLIIVMLILLSLMPMVSAWCFLGIGDTCGLEELSSSEQIMTASMGTLDNIKNVDAITSKFGTTNITMIKDSIFTELKSNDALKKEAVFTMDSTKLSANDSLSIVFNEVCGHVNSYELYVVDMCTRLVETCREEVIDNKTAETKRMCVTNNESYDCNERPYESKAEVKNVKIKNVNITLGSCTIGNYHYNYKIDWKPVLTIGSNVLVDDKWAWWTSADYGLYDDFEAGINTGLWTNTACTISTTAYEGTKSINCTGGTQNYASSNLSDVMLTTGQYILSFWTRAENIGTGYDTNQPYFWNNTGDLTHLCLTLNGGYPITPYWGRVYSSTVWTSSNITSTTGIANQNVTWINIKIMADNDNGQSAIRFYNSTGSYTQGNLTANSTYVSGSNGCGGNLQEMKIFASSNTVLYDKIEVWNYTKYGWNYAVDAVAPVVIANSPANNNFASNQTPSFNFTYTDETNTTGSCTLFINTTYAAGTNSSVLNNTATIITSNITLGIGLYNWTINCSDGTNTNISEVRNITISETPTINFFTNTTTEGNYYHLTQNWIYISVNTTNFESNTTINLYDNTGLYDTQTGLSNFSYNFTSLPNNNYIINATANNGTSQINTTTNKNYVIYSFITTINNPVLNENISRIININYTDTITPTGAATITSHNISIMNPNGSLNFTINSSTNNNQTYDFLNILTIINNYSVQIKTLDNNSNQKIFNRTFILTRNANLNITVKKYLDNSSINNFTINITDEITGVNEEYNTTNGIINISVINQRNYTITTFSQNYTINITHININKTYNDISIILLDYNSLYITFYYEINDSIFNESTVYYDIISDNYSHSYNTSNGILNINNIPPGNYTSRYYSAGYVERFFSFIMINYTGQIVNLYLQENLTSILITLRYNNYAAITGATIKAQKFIIATTDYLDIESGITNSEGQLIMSLTLNDEYYRFIVTLAGETILTTERSYIISNNINLFISIGSNAGDNYFDYKTIDYNMYYDYSTNQFWCIYNDVSSTTNEYCLRLLYTNGSTVYDCTTSSAGNLFINITPFNGSVYVGTCYVKIDGDWLSLISRTVSFDDIAGFAREGLFVQVIISIIFILVCLRWPEFIPVSFGLSLMLGRVIQINILSYEVLGGIIFTAIIISAWLGRQKNG